MKMTLHVTNYEILFSFEYFEENNSIPKKWPKLNNLFWIFFVDATRTGPTAHLFMWDASWGVRVFEAYGGASASQ